MAVSRLEAAVKNGKDNIDWEIRVVRDLVENVRRWKICGKAGTMCGMLQSSAAKNIGQILSPTLFYYWLDRFTFLIQSDFG
jgi:hypothetical protein